MKARINRRGIMRSILFLTLFLSIHANAGITLIKKGGGSSLTYVPWTSAGAMTVTATTTSPTKGTTTTDDVSYRVIGDMLIAKYTLVMTGAGTAGSGTYLFAMPAGYKIDTTALKGVPGSPATNFTSMVGYGHAEGGGTGFAFIVEVYDEDRLFVRAWYSSGSPGDASLMDDSFFSFAQVRNWSFTINVPIQ